MTAESGNSPRFGMASMQGMPHYAFDTIVGFQRLAHGGRWLWQAAPQLLFRPTRLIPARASHSVLHHADVVRVSVNARKVLPLSDVPIPFLIFLDNQPSWETVVAGGTVEIELSSPSDLSGLGLSMTGKAVR